jgi:glycosyltransferase involved in cell wall biosynthesis
MTLRVLVTHERFPPDYGGGGEYVALRTAQGLIAAGVEVRVLTAGDPAITAHEGVPTTRLPTSRYGFNLRVAAIARAARDVDLIHSFNYHACLPSLAAARLARKPVVCHVLALFGRAWRTMRGPLAGSLFETYERFMISRRFDRTLFLSDASREAGIAMGAAPETSFVLNPAIDHARLLPPDRTAPLVVFAGKLEARKGIRHVLAVARALPDIPFAAVGWADDIEALRAAAPPNLEIVASAQDDRFLRYLSRAAIFFFPSYSETFGIVVAEAMASGAAIVSSIDTIPFDGALVAPGDEAAMQAAIRDLWHDPTRLRALGEANRRRAAAMSWAAHTERLLGIYDGMRAAPARVAA